MVYEIILFKGVFMLGQNQAPPKKRRAIDATKCSWSVSQKIEAVQTYLLLGNATHTAKVLKIPDATLNYWRGCDWWKELERDIKAQERIELSNRLKKIVNNSLSLVEDRLEKGDFIYDQKAGKLIRKPMQAKDIHKIAVDMMDRRENLDMHREVVQNQQSIAEKLQQLAETFSSTVTKKEVIDVEDAVEIKEIE